MILIGSLRSINRACQHGTGTDQKSTS